MHTNPVVFDDYLEKWAITKIKRSHRWGITYWCLHNGFLIVSWLLSLGVLVGIPILYLSDKQYSCVWNILILVATGSALVLQVLDVVLFFRDRAARGRRMSANLESALLKYRGGGISKEEFLSAISEYLDEEWNEQSC
jgi:hypothetical protein